MELGEYIFSHCSCFIPVENVVYALELSVSACWIQSSPVQGRQNAVFSVPK